MGYPQQQPYDEGYLKVNDIHTLYYMQCGNPNGKAVLFLHGGPGGSINATDTVFFNPEVYRVFMFCQRGAGKSTPVGETRENTTWDLVNDIEVLRKHVGIEDWIVFGGSWGSTLALAYSQKHPQKVKALCLRGIYAIRQSEIDFLWLTGTKQFYPEEWEEFAALVPKSSRGSMEDFGLYYQKLFNDPDEKVAQNAAKVWSVFETRVSRLRPDTASVTTAAEDLNWLKAHSNLECHYALNKGFMPEGYLLQEEQIAKIRHIPCKVIQGRYDVVCPPFTAHDLKRVYGSNLELTLVAEGGHSPKEPAMLAEVVKAMDDFASL